MQPFRLQISCFMSHVSCLLISRAPCLLFIHGLTSLMSSTYYIRYITRYVWCCCVCPAGKKCFFVRISFIIRASCSCQMERGARLGKLYVQQYSSRRPQRLGRLSSCLLKSISRVQFSPSAHTRGTFSCIKKLITCSGKRESVS